MICVDTTVLIDEFRAKGDTAAAVNRTLLALGAELLIVPVIAAGEFLDGAAMVSENLLRESMKWLGRRRVVGATVIFAVASVVVTSGAFASNPSPAEQVVPRTVIAKSGDTLWDIARTIVPRGSVADLVSEMVRLNGSHIEPGQVIRIP